MKYRAIEQQRTALWVATITWYIISSYVATGVPMRGTVKKNTAEMIRNQLDDCTKEIKKDNYNGHA